MTPDEAKALVRRQNVAYAAGLDAGNRSMRRAGRSKRNADDHQAACAEYVRIMDNDPKANANGAD